jgi:hypothetical protein
MSTYTIAIDWAGKDSLSDSDVNKVISGTDFNTEFTTIQTAVNQKANKNGTASETFSAKTAAAPTNTTQVATTAFVTTAQTNAQNDTSLTGVPTAPTATSGTDTTQVATTEYIQGEIYDNKNTADNPVVLDSDAKLPAVDGSLLTGLVTTGTGYARIGGIIIQWGVTASISDTTVIVTLPVAFTGTSYQVSGSRTTTHNGATTSHWFTDTYTKTTFRAGAPASNGGLHWIAIGV